MLFLKIYVLLSVENKENEQAKQYEKIHVP